MQYSLRTLLIAMLASGPLSAYCWTVYCDWQDWREQQLSAAKSQITWQPAIMVSAQVYMPSIPYEQLSEEEKAEIEDELRRINDQLKASEQRGPGIVDRWVPLSSEPSARRTGE